MNNSYWIASSKHNTYDKLKEDISTDTVVVGGGMVGVSTAYLLARRGIDVVLVDANKIGHGSSGRNTGKITSQHCIVYSKIKQKYGLESAKLYYEANESAISFMEEVVKRYNIDCSFERVKSYMFAVNENYLEDLKDEYETCKKLNIPCEYYEDLDLPIDIKGAISFKNQAQFNPKKYIDGLLKECQRIGVKIYENTPIIDLEKGKVCKIKSRDNKIISANNVVISSHAPWYDGMELFFTKEKADRSYLVCAKMEKEIPKGIFVGVEDDGMTLRTLNENNHKYLIFGGGDHKVGQCKNEEEIFEKLKDFARDRFGVKDFIHQWSTQDYMSYDHLPYIGHINKKQKNIYVATGFNKWGMSTSTVAAKEICDLIVDKKSRYKDLFNPSRKGAIFTYDFLKEGLNVGYEYLAGKLNYGSDELPTQKGDAKVVVLGDDKRYGAYRHFNDKLYIVDITCTHMGCELTFNSAEKTWDCP
ncbi:MAG: FAD-dependent oxidoreductase, partial [Peptostreptococcaceae bacterium]